METILRNRIVALLVTLLLLGALWAPDFLGYNHSSLPFWLPCVATQYDGSLFDTAGYRLITVLMAVINALAILLFSTRFLSLGKANAVIPLFYLLVLFSYPQARLFSSALPASLFAILGLFALFRAGETKTPYAPIFLASFLSGCACLLYLPSFVIVVSFCAMAIRLSLFSGRKILVFMGGLLFTFGGCILYRYLLFGTFSDFTGPFFDGFNHLKFRFFLPPPTSLFMTLSFFYLFGKGVLRWLHHSSGNMSYRYRVLTAVIWMFFVCAIGLLLYTGNLFGYLPLFAIPSSILLAYNFSEERITKRTKVEFVVLLLSIFLNQVAYLM